jgi:Cdc6-like AAA superfamily ATPase
MKCNEAPVYANTHIAYDAEKGTLTAKANRLKGCFIVIAVNNLIKGGTITDGNKSASWVYLANKFYKINPIPSSNFKFYLASGYPSVGSQTPIISYKSNEELQKSKKMEEKLNLLKYKKQIILQGPPGTGKTREAKLIAKEMLGLAPTDDL